MTSKGYVELRYSYDSTRDYTSFDESLLSNQDITIRSETTELNVHQYFNLFKSFLRAIDFAEYSIIKGACELAFNDSNREDEMKRIAAEYDLDCAPKPPYLTPLEVMDVKNYFETKELSERLKQDPRLVDALNLCYDYFSPTPLNEEEAPN
jgi:hypothetical protein